MPDEARPKHPVPRMPDVVTFIRRYGDHAACSRHLKETRWGANLERFVCPELRA